MPKKKFAAPESAAINDTSALATIKTKKSEIFSECTALAPVVQTVESLAIPTQKQVDALTDEEVAGGLRCGGTLVHVASKFLKAYAVSFLRRFKLAKKTKAKFCGEYRPNLDRACPELTGYSSRQIRNIADGTPTPKPNPKLSAEEKKFRADAKELQAQVDAAVAERRHEKEMRNDGYTPAQKAAVTPQAPAVPVTVKQTPVNGDVAARDARDLDEAVALLRAMLYALPAGKLSPELKAAKKAAVVFIESHGGLGTPPLPPSGKPRAVRKAAKQEAAKQFAATLAASTAKNAAALKNEPSQGTPVVPVFTGTDADDSLTHGEIVSDAAKGTGVTVNLVSRAAFNKAKRKSTAVL
jgi:hypothetical protein